MFPEQQLKYIQATVKQTSTYRSPRYPMPGYLIERPHSVQGICLLNIERGKSIPVGYITKLPEYIRLRRGLLMHQTMIPGQLIFPRVTVHAQHFKHLVYLANTCLQFSIIIIPHGGDLTFRNPSLKHLTCLLIFSVP